MGRSVRQCHRLHQCKGLPVHRVPGTRSVFAYKEELDRWLLGTEDRPGASNGAQADPTGPRAFPLSGGPNGHETREEAPEIRKPASRSRVGWGAMALVGVFGVAVLLSFMLIASHGGGTPWYEGGSVLGGLWIPAGSSITGESAAVGRYDTGHLVGPGTTVSVLLESYGSRWAGGLEILRDDLHWTFVSISPRERQIIVQRFPAGTVTTFPVGTLLQPGRPFRLVLAVGEAELLVGNDGEAWERLPMDPWDVTAGRLVLRVGSPGDETHAPAGGSCSFSDLRVEGEPEELPPFVVQPVPVSRRPSADYELTVDNIDDQVDVLIDGRLLATAGYREAIGPLSLTPFLGRGEHTLTILVFNRKWTASYAVHLSKDGTEIWHDACGSVTTEPYGCEAIGQRLGMVRELRYTFSTQ